MINPFHMTYLEFYDSALPELLKQIKFKMKTEKIKYDYVLANLRGGFYLGDALSRSLKIPLKVCNVSFRDNVLLSDENILLPVVNVRERYLFVDDVIDSGATINNSKIHDKKNIDICVLYKNAKTQIMNKVFCYSELEENENISFFWEI